MNDIQNNGLLATIVGSVKGFFVRAYVRHSVYSKLARLSDRMLADIGLTRGDIKRIANEAAMNAGRGKTQPTVASTQSSAKVVTLPVDGKVAANDSDRAVAA